MDTNNTSNWKTTAAGICAGIGVLLTQVSYVLDTDPNTTLSIEAILAALGMIGIGWLAKDAKK